MSLLASQETNFLHSLLQVFIKAHAAWSCRPDLLSVSEQSQTMGWSNLECKTLCRVDMECITVIVHSVFMETLVYGTAVDKWKYSSTHNMQLSYTAPLGLAFGSNLIEYPIRLLSSCCPSKRWLVLQFTTIVMHHLTCRRKWPTVIVRIRSCQNKHTTPLTF